MMPARRLKVARAASRWLFATRIMPHDQAVSSPNSSGAEEVSCDRCQGGTCLGPFTYESRRFLIKMMPCTPMWRPRFLSAVQRDPLARTGRAQSRRAGHSV